MRDIHFFDAEYMQDEMKKEGVYITMDEDQRDDPWGVNPEDWDALIDVSLGDEEFDENWAGPEPAIDGSDTELEIEALAARLSMAGLLYSGVIDEVDVPARKPWTYLAHSASQTSSISGWRLYDRKHDASRYSGGKFERAVTIFDDGTWEYGVRD